MKKFFKDIERNTKRILKAIEYAAMYSSALVRDKLGKKALSKDTLLATTAGHQNWQKHLYELGNRAGFRILEIGSREVTAVSSARKEFANAEYVGFDFYPGNNVDVVGDVHRLSTYFKEGEKFDIIYSSACFEHFAMPWIAAVEIAKMLKVGGLVCIETHFAFSSHERPWHFFHFTDMGLRTLFSPALGFECIDAGFSNPMVGRIGMKAAKNLRNVKIKGLYCHTSYLGRKTREVENFRWENQSLEEVVGDTKYPAPIRQ